MCNQIPVNVNNSRANFSSKMSKLFGYVGRVKNACPNLSLSILGYKVGRVHLICTYVQIFLVFFQISLLKEFFDSIIPSLRTSKVQNGSQTAPKWLSGGPKMAHGVWRGVCPQVFGRSRQLSLNKNVVTERKRRKEWWKQRFTIVVR